jgi:hypothetical protein
MKNRLITTTAGSRMIAREGLHKPTHHRTEAQRLVTLDSPNKLAARPAMPATSKPEVVRAKSDWGDDAGKAGRRGRDAAAARAEARREAAPRQPVKAIIAS